MMQTVTKDEHPTFISDNVCVFFPDLPCPVQNCIDDGSRMKKHTNNKFSEFSEGEPPFFTEIAEKFSVLSSYCGVCPLKMGFEVTKLGATLDELSVQLLGLEREARIRMIRLELERYSVADEEPET